MFFLLSLAFAVPVQLSQQGRLLESDSSPVEGVILLRFVSLMILNMAMFYGKKSNLFPL